jgi:hygromycin-B 7''-O-kinase
MMSIGELSPDFAAKLVSAPIVDSVVPLHGGNNSAVFEVARADQRVVVKIFSDALHWKMAKEAFVYRLLEPDAGLPLAHVSKVDDSKSVVPFNVLVMTKLTGRHVHSLLPELGEEELMAIYREIGSLLHRLHSHRMEQFGYIGVDGVGEGFESNGAYMGHQFDRKVGQFVELGGSKDLCRAIADFVDDRKNVLDGCETAVLCHNDCHEGNVLVERQGASGWRISGLLDLENALAGDPLLDISKTYSYSTRRGDATLGALVDGYGDLRSDWRQALDVYLVYHALELWDWFAQTRTTAPLTSIEEDMRRLTAGQPLLARS